MGGKVNNNGNWQQRGWSINQTEGGFSTGTEVLNGNEINLRWEKIHHSIKLNNDWFWVTNWSLQNYDVTGLWGNSNSSPFRSGRKGSFGAAVGKRPEKLRYGVYSDVLNWAKYLYENGITNPTTDKYYNLADIANFKTFPYVHNHNPFNGWNSMMGKNGKSFQVKGVDMTFGYGNVELIKKGKFALNNYIRGFSMNVSKEWGAYQLYLHNDRMGSAVISFTTNTYKNFEDFFKLITGDDYIYYKESDNEWVSF